MVANQWRDSVRLKGKGRRNMEETRWVENFSVEERGYSSVLVSQSKRKRRQDITFTNGWKDGGTVRRGSLCGFHRQYLSLFPSAVALSLILRLGVSDESE